MYGTQGTNDIERDLDIAWESINAISWATLAQDEFSEQMARWFPPLWKVHPFREENTRTVVMLMTFYAEYYGYYFDQALLAASAKYVRDSFVLACIEPRYAEFEHLERILKDAVSSEPIEYTFDLDDEPILKQSEKYSTYGVRTGNLNLADCLRYEALPLPSFCSVCCYAVLPYNSKSNRE